MSDTVIQFNHVSKEYRLGILGGGSLNRDLQTWWAKIHGREDPNAMLGAKQKHRSNERFLALQDISFEVRRGEVLGIIGRNGAGKSTLLKLLSRVTAPTKGSISYMGRVASMLEVGTGFHSELTGRENVFLNGAILGMTRVEIARKFDEIVDFAEIEQFIDTPVKRYSSGMYVKLAFAVAAHLDSEILVMDEVLAVGDMKYQQKCLSRMNDAAVRESRTVLFVSHNMTTVQQLCSRGLVLDKGKLVFDGAAEKGIERYLCNSSIGDMTYMLDTVARPYDHMGVRIRMKNFALVDKMSNVYRYNEELKFRLEFKATGKIDRVRLRIEVHYADGTTVGTAETNDFRIATNGEYAIIAGFDASNLAPGLYYLELDIYELNDINRHLTYDHPMQQIYFEIMDADKDHIVWEHRYMGHVVLNRLSLTGMF